MSSTLTRRDFMLKATVTLAGAAALSWPGRAGRAQAAEASSKPLYAFPVLGDIHYDLMAHHDLDWVRREKGEGDLRQIRGYVEASTQYTPRLMNEVRRSVQRVDAPVPFVVQIGDFVEGLCGSYELQVQQFRDAIQLVEDSQLGAPFLITKGNHDITGPGAPQAYDDVLVPWLSQQARKPLDRATYFVRHDQDLVIFFDAYQPDLDWLETTLAANPARHVFFVIHPPVVPYNPRATWTIYAKPNERPQRERLLELLGRHRAIVLSGHLHQYSLLSRQTSTHPFVQLAVLSVIRREDTQPRDVLEGVEHFGPELVELSPRFSPGTVDRRREILAAEKPFIRHYEYAYAPGYAMVKVYADRVDAEIYVGLEERAWKRHDLRAVQAAASLTPQ